MSRPTMGSPMQGSVSVKPQRGSKTTVVAFWLLARLQSSFRPFLCAPATSLTAIDAPKDRGRVEVPAQCPAAAAGFGAATLRISGTSMVAMMKASITALKASA